MHGAVETLSELCLRACWYKPCSPGYYLDHVSYLAIFVIIMRMHAELRSMRNKISGFAIIGSSCANHGSMAEWQLL